MRLPETHIKYDSRVGAYWVNDAGIHYLTNEQFKELIRFQWGLIVTSLIVGLVGATLLMISMMVVL